VSDDAVKFYSVILDGIRRKRPFDFRPQETQIAGIQYVNGSPPDSGRWQGKRRIFLKAAIGEYADQRKLRFSSAA